MKSILITGGSGFIGSHTCLLLLERGYEVFVIDSFVTSKPNVLGRVLDILKKMNINAKNRLHFQKGDLRNPNDIESIFIYASKLNKPIDGVIHFAGLKSVSESNKEPLKYWEFNLIGTLNLLKIMGKFSCKNFIFSSSATVYKSNGNKLLRENDVLSPTNTYGDTKLVIENILTKLFISSNEHWKIACLRYFNPIGAHPSGIIGEDPMGKINNIYPRLIKAAIGEIDEIKIFGSDWPTEDGTAIRDYIHVVDLAEGHLAALDFLIKEKPQILKLNLGTAKGTSVLDLINVFQKVNKVKIPFSFVDRREGDNAIVVADNSLAKKLLNWKPNKNIEDMCIDGWRWQSKKFNCT